MKCEMCIHYGICVVNSYCHEPCGYYEEERPHGEWKKESAIDYLTEIGWLPEHDRILTERPQWIPCSERLPEKSGEYYVSGGDKVWICSFLIIPTFRGGWCNNVSNPVVEAWMPLPTPYREEGE